jgi:hypothetical protein
MRGPTPKDALSTDWPTSRTFPFSSPLPTTLNVVLHDAPELTGCNFAVKPNGEAMQLPELL